MHMENTYIPPNCHICKQKLCKEHLPEQRYDVIILTREILESFDKFHDAKDDNIKKIYTYKIYNIIISALDIWKNNIRLKKMAISKIDGYLSNEHDKKLLGESNLNYYRYWINKELQN